MEPRILPHPAPRRVDVQSDQRARAGEDANGGDPVVGRLLDGRYRIGPRIARGGMASVYEATDIRLDRTVAVKIMHPGLGDDDDFASRFVREARAAARLSHPHVVGVFDQGDDAGTVFLVMELVPGHTLRDVIRKEAPMAPGRALALIDPVLSALAHAHRSGLIHRDIKPENVLIGDDGRRQGRRLRAREGGQRRHPAHRDRRRPDRHRLLPRARAGRRRARRRARRRLRRRRRALRAAHRRQAPRGRVADPGRLQARPRGRAAALCRRPRAPGVRRRAGRPRHRPRPRAAARRRRRAAPPGAPGRPGARHRRRRRRRADGRPEAGPHRSRGRHRHGARPVRCRRVRHPADAGRGGRGRRTSRSTPPAWCPSRRARSSSRRRVFTPSGPSARAGHAGVCC